MGPFTSTKPLFSSRNTTLGTHGSLWADICVPKSIRNHHYWGLLRAPNHGFPRGILHLAHMAPYGLTFVVKITSYDTPYTHIFHWKRRLGIHEGHQIVHFHAYMQPSILTSRASSIHSSISSMFSVLVKLMSWRVGGVARQPPYETLAYETPSQQGVTLP